MDQGIFNNSTIDNNHCTLKVVETEIAKKIREDKTMDLQISVCTPIYLARSINSEHNGS